MLSHGLVAPQRARQMATAATEIEQTPSETVYTENTLALRQYESVAEPEQRVDVPLVIVYAIINRPYILDLQSDRSVVRRFLERGFNVYLIDWGEPSLLDSSLTIGDYADRYLGNCVDVVRDRAGTAAVNLLGYCTGGTFAAIFAALYPERVNALGLLAPVLNFDVEEGIFRSWAHTEAADPDQVVTTCGTVPGEWLALQFSLQAPFEYHLGRYLRLVEHLDDEAYVKGFARRLHWGSDPVDVAGTVYRQILVDLYRKNNLMTGDLTVNGTDVDIGNITMPVIDILGTDDRFIPPEASRPFMDAILSDDTEIHAFPAGHVELSTSEQAHAGLWPQVGEWYVQRS